MYKVLETHLTHLQCFMVCVTPNTQNGNANVNQYFFFYFFFCHTYRFMVILNIKGGGFGAFSDEMSHQKV